MASPVKVSKYRSGVPRFGRVDIDWNPADALKTYKLTPEELEQYKAGEKSIEEILRDRESDGVARKPLQIAIDQYVALKLKGLKEKDIAAQLNVTSKQLANWKSYRKGEIENELNKAKLEPIKQTEGKTTQKELKHENEQKNKELELLKNELRKEYESKIDKLKREVIDAHKPVTEWQEEYDKLRERFSAALDTKDQALKANHSLENQIHNQRTEIELLQKEINELNKEIKPLRELMFINLQKEVETA